MIIFSSGAKDGCSGMAQEVVFMNSDTSYILKPVHSAAEAFYTLYIHNVLST
jgi:hypothetical protein